MEETRAHYECIFAYSHASCSFCGTRGRGFGQHVHRQHQRQTWLTHHWCGRFWPLVHAPYRHVCSFIEFPITPVTWLKYDPSGIVCLIAGFAYGPAAAAIVSVLGFVPHMFANPWGSLMAVLVALFLSVPAAFIYRKIRTRKGAAIGILVGAVLAIVVALVSNLIVTPIYAHMTYQAVAAMILPILLPFNVAKMAIHAVITFLIYKPISNLLSKQQ